MKNSASSIRQRLLNQARSTKSGFDTLLEQYAMSRLFWRLSQSEYSDQFILKGAQLFRLWFTNPHRPTRDIDFLSYGEASNKALEAIFEKICSISSDDGLLWEKPLAHYIREDNTYGGQRLKLVVTLDGARIPLQIDVGFGDVITPAPVTVSTDSFLQFERAKLFSYPPETVIAEKIEAAVVLGIANSRMKDFYDLLWLIRHQSFSYTLIIEAITNTFNRRKTIMPTALPMAYTAEFSEDHSKQIQWKAFLRKSNLYVIPFDEAIRELQHFVEPLFIRNSQYTSWTPDGRWR